MTDTLLSWRVRIAIFLLILAQAGMALLHFWPVREYSDLDRYLDIVGSLLILLSFLIVVFLLVELRAHRLRHGKVPEAGELGWVAWPIVSTMALGILLPLLTQLGTAVDATWLWGWLF